MDQLRAEKSHEIASSQSETYPWYPPELDVAADEPSKHEAENE